MHGPRTTVAQAVERPPHHTGGHIRLPQDFAVHGDGLIRARRGKVRTHRVLVDGRASRQIQDWHVVSERLRQAAHAVLRAGTALRDDHAKLLAVVHPTVPVRGHDRPALLPEHDRTDALLGNGLNEIVGRKAREPLDAFRFQDTGNSLKRIHSDSSVSWL